MSIVERIRNLCKSENTTLAALERELNLSNGSIAKWDKSTPSIEKILLITNRFNVNIDWLVTGKEAAELTPNEQELIELYRNTNDIGQPLITNHAKDIQKALPRQDINQEIKPEIKLSDSKIG